MSSIRLNSNIASLIAQRRLGQVSSALEQSYARLSSGLRINRAGDDAAGLSISEDLRADSRVYAQGIRNLNDGISLLNTSEEALRELSSNLIRMGELAEQAANGTYSTKQRQALDRELQALREEHNRIVSSIEFNGRNLFTESSDLVLQAGYGENGSLRFSAPTTVIQGAPDGTFTLALTNSYPSQALVVADFNEDGIPDLASGHYDSFERIYLGQGDGSFSLSQMYSAGAVTQSAHAYDFNGDGHLDIGWLSYADTFGVSLGNGNGTFKSVNYHYVGDRPVASTLADVNNDGKIDVIVKNWDEFQSIALGAGDGTFAASISYSDGRTGGRIFTGDFNGDGAVDLVYDGMNIRLGNGDGTFEAAQQAGSGGVFGVADLNEDGRDDVISLPNIFFGNGDATFSVSLGHTVAANGNSIIQDLNSDGSLDIAVVNATDSSFELFLGNGDGTFDASVSYTTPETDARGIAAGDFNLDGAFDIAVSLNENGFAIFEQGVSADTIGSAVRELAPMSIATVSTARETLTKIEREKENISCAIVAYGAFQNRVAVAITHLRSLTENIRAAESQITSVDVAQEAAELVRKNILMQAGMAVLAQANKQPQIALKLLEEI